MSNCEAAGKSVWRQGEFIVAGKDADSLIVLPYEWIAADSVVVRKNGHILEPLRDYRVVPPGNRVRLSSPLIHGDTVSVSFTYAPFSLARSYFRRSLSDLRQLESASDSVALQSSVSSIESESSGWSNLRRSGSLVRSVQIGTNQDLAFESALSLQVEGKVGSNVDVIAALSDQNLPIQPEGTTESVRELDQVYVTARSPHFEATIGDYELDLGGRRFDGYSRKLSGVTLQSKAAWSSTSVAAAVGRGEFHTNRLDGVESVQGPYSLTGKNGETNIVVLAGTETVWLDGETQRRGIDNDYVIDYAAGQITFTSRKLITSDSRIIIEFEYANEDYERQYWAARTSLHPTRLGGAAHVTYVTERDDRARPLGFTIDEEDSEALRRAGDSVSFAVSPSADSIGPNAGDYVRRDTLIDGRAESIFVYVTPSGAGEPQGQWQVFFDDFGNGGGDYNATADDLGRTYFVFVGGSRGRYRATRRIPLPVSQELLALRLERPVTGGFRSNVEVALSSRDQNTFSGADDADNQGLATSADFGFDRPVLRAGGVKLHQFSAGVEGSFRGATFTDIARSDAVEFDRDWGGSATREANEVVGQAALGFSPIRTWSIRGSAGVLDREEAFGSQRLDLTSSFQPSQVTLLRVQQVSIRSNDSTDNRTVDWIRQRVESKTSWRIASPRLVLTRERQLRDADTNDSGFRFADWVIGSGLRLTRDFSADGEFSVRNDDFRNAERVFERSSDAASVSGELQWLPQELGRAAVRWVHRDKRFSSADSASVASDAGRMEFLLTPRNRVVELNVVYDALKSRTEQQLQIFVPVTPGTGSYSLIGGQYVPDDQGSYELVSRNSGTYEPSSEINTSGLLWFRPDERRGVSRDVWSRFAFETEASLEERTRRPLTLGLLLLDKGRLRDDETIDGRFSLRQDVHFNRLSRDISIRLRGLNSASQLSRFTNGSQQNVRREGSFRVRYRALGNVRCESELSAELERSLFEGVSVASSDVTRQTGKQDVAWSISERWEAGLRASGAEARDERSGTQASVRGIAPRVSYTAFRKGRADADLNWIHVSSNKIRLPQELAEGGNRGENYRWSLRINISLAENFSGSLAYTGRRDAGEETVNTGRVEVRATF